MKILMMGNDPKLSAECIKHGFRLVTEADYDKSTKVFLSSFDRSAIKYADVCPNVDRQLRWHSTYNQFLGLRGKLPLVPYSLEKEYSSIAEELGSSFSLIFQISGMTDEVRNIGYQLDFATATKEHNGEPYIAIVPNSSANYRMYCIRNRILGCFSIDDKGNEQTAPRGTTQELIDACKTICAVTGLQYYSADFVRGTDGEFLLKHIDTCPNSSRYASKIVDKVVHHL